jgi:hypothetical protein
MKPKTKEMLDLMLSNPKLSATSAYLETHETNSPATARANASKLLASTNNQIYLQKHISKAKRKIVKLVDSKSDKIALQASESILDRELGKPVQRQEVKSTRITISLGSLTDTTQ